MLLPATTTTTATSSEQPHQLQRTFQTWSSTLFDDGHYSDVSGSGAAARIPSDYDYYNYIEMDQLSAVDEGAVEQHQASYDNYQGLDPSVLARLRQPPAPSVYERLIPDVPDMNQGVLNAGPGDANLDNVRIRQVCFLMRTMAVVQKAHDRLYTMTSQWNRGRHHLTRPYWRLYVNRQHRLSMPV